MPRVRTEAKIKGTTNNFNWGIVKNIFLIVMIAVAGVMIYTGVCNV